MMKNFIKFVGVVAGIVAASVVIDKLVDKVYEEVKEETEMHDDSTDANGKTADINVSAATCKTIVKAAVGATALIISNKHTAKKVCDVAFKYGVEGGIRCATTAFVDFGLSGESGEQLLTDADALIRFRDKVLPTAKQAYFG